MGSPRSAHRAVSVATCTKKPLNIHFGLLQKSHQDIFCNEMWGLNSISVRSCSVLSYLFLYLPQAPAKAGVWDAGEVLVLTSW